MPGLPSRPLPLRADPGARWFNPGAPAEARDEGSGLEDATGVGLDPLR